MDKNKAWEIVSNICKQVSATREQHKIIDDALEALKPEETKV